LKTKALILILFCNCIFAQNSKLIEAKLKKAYPNFIVAIKNNNVVFKDQSVIIFDDGKQKSIAEKLQNSDIEDMFFLNYKLNNRNDAGRCRNEMFFKKMYGHSKLEVQKNLETIVWCPKLVNQKILITKVNHVADSVKKLSAELDKHPEFLKYLQNIGGTFNWRKIAGTNRLSNHSFGMTIDINTKYSNYWQWECKCSNENSKVNYKNQIPLKLVQLFEKYGFIWGGNWTHFDTMHFEFRPELLE
jgi:hypothetical protein